MVSSASCVLLKLLLLGYISLVRQFNSLYNIPHYQFPIVQSRKVSMSDEE